jgi:hypothetical protein
MTVWKKIGTLPIKARQYRKYIDKNKNNRINKDRVDDAT